ncbi:MAG TPA: ferric reductase-like transmembrane domain-containing protein [Candidatus Eisenbacteria bacterium]
MNSSPPWFAGKAWGVFLVTLYPLLAVTPLVAFAALNRASDHLRVAEVGVDCAVVAFTTLALQFVITARLSWVEAPFGLDVLFVFHRAMALLATALLCVHPLLVAREEGWSLLVGLRVDWYVWVGRVALTVLLLHVVVSASRRVVRLSYDQWRRIHQPVALTILTLGFVHSVAAGEDMRGGGLLVWGAMAAITFGSWFYGRVVRPRLMLRRPFRVIAVEPEAARVWTLTLEAPRGRPFRFVPGQFQFLRLHGAGVPPEEHPFTIASSPARPGRIGLTIKESGDFTAGIGRVRPGALATVHGPFGRFSHALHPEERDLVFVAGGVGITPLMSMLRSMRDRSEERRVLLAYACRTAADLLFTEELEAMRAGVWPSLRVVPILDQAPATWEGETGRLDADRLARLCGGTDGKAFYLCCPPPMMTALVRGLRRLGVSPRRIHADYFSL